ncbi:flippase [Microcoleus sp. herbarium12]|jgi:O-antigen/teichoic acid export membrane protein|uniref:flippase n=1 Tax=Microcoleus sp. herbarium12 TaxID=3055437 RepID=UPI002FD190AA
MLDKLTALSQKLGAGLGLLIDNLVGLLDRGLQVSLGLFVGVWVARYLGPTQFGLLNYAIALVSLFASGTAIGLGTLVVRDIARDPECKEEALGTAFIIQLVGGMITLLLSVSAIAILNPDDSLTLTLVVIVSAGTMFQSFETINFWFQSQVQSKYTAVAKNSVSLLIAGIRIGLIQLGAPLTAFAWTTLAEVALGGLAIALVYQSRGNDFKLWLFSWRRGKQMLVESWPLVLSSLAVFVYSKIDLIMLGAFDKTELGYYAVAVRISEFFDFLPLIIASAIFSKLAQLRQKDYGEYLKKFQIYSDVMLFLWLGVGVPISLLAPVIVQILYGDGYAASGGLLSIYIWTQFGTNFGIARNTYFALEGQLRYNLYLTVAGAIFNIVLNALLIPQYGAVGAITATLITYFYVTILVNFYIKQLNPFAKIIMGSLNLYKAASRLLGAIG